jgi:hypothetical protein
MVVWGGLWGCVLWAGEPNVAVYRTLLEDPDPQRRMNAYHSTDGYLAAKKRKLIADSLKFSDVPHLYRLAIVDALQQIPTTTVLDALLSLKRPSPSLDPIKRIEYVQLVVNDAKAILDVVSYFPQLKADTEKALITNILNSSQGFDALPLKIEIFALLIDPSFFKGSWDFPESLNLTPTLVRHFLLEAFVFDAPLISDPAAAAIAGSYSLDLLEAALKSRAPHDNLLALLKKLRERLGEGLDFRLETARSLVPLLAKFVEDPRVELAHAVRDLRTHIDELATLTEILTKRTFPMETLGLSVLDRIGNRIGDPSFYNPERKIRLLNLIALKSGLKKPFKEKAQAILKNKKIIHISIKYNKSKTLKITL